MGRPRSHPFEGLGVPTLLLSSPRWIVSGLFTSIKNLSGWMVGCVLVPRPSALPRQLKIEGGPGLHKNILLEISAVTSTAAIGISVKSVQQWIGEWVALTLVYE